MLPVRFGALQGQPTFLTSPDEGQAQFAHGYSRIQIPGHAAETYSMSGQLQGDEFIVHASDVYGQMNRIEMDKTTSQAALVRPRSQIAGIYISTRFLLTNGTLSMPDTGDAGLTEAMSGPKGLAMKEFLTDALSLRDQLLAHLTPTPRNLKSYGDLEI